MTKKDFHKFIQTITSCLSVNNKIKLLLKIKNDWLSSEIWKLKDQSKQCPKCHRYFLKKELKHTIKRGEIRHELIYSDFECEDNNRYGDIEYDVEYSICPLCHKKFESAKYEIRIL